MSSLTNFISNAIAQEKLPALKLKRLSEHIWKINAFIQAMNRLQVDEYEYAFLRFLTIFNAGWCLHNTSYVHQLIFN